MKRIMGLLGLSSVLLATLAYSVSVLLATDGNSSPTPPQVSVTAEGVCVLTPMGGASPVDSDNESEPVQVQPHQSGSVTARSYDQTVHTTKAELLADWQEGYEASQDFIALMEAEHPSLAAATRERYLAERARIERLQCDEVVLKVPVVETSFEAGN